MKTTCEICGRGTYDSDISVENDRLILDKETLLEEKKADARRIATLEGLVREISADNDRQRLILRSAGLEK